jgi:hypothetical protein
MPTDSPAGHERRIAVLESQSGTHEKHLDRHDTAIEKLAEISTQLKEIVKHQADETDKLHQEKINLWEELEKRREIIDAHRQTAQQEISTLNTAFTTSITNLQTTFNNSITDIKKEFNDSVGSLQKKIMDLDRYKWIIIGAGVVLLWLSDHWEVVQTLFTR